MLAGIDVGGTYTDGVVLENHKLLKYTKVLTGEDIGRSVGTALSQLLGGLEAGRVARLVLSTTLITNLLARKKTEPVGLLLLPGPGVNPVSLNFCAETTILSGAVDYRGRIIETVDLAEADEAVAKLLNKGIRHIALACKFSVRNPALEQEIAAHLQQNYPQLEILCSHEVYGLLNWVRRANSTVLQLQVRRDYQALLQEIQTKLAELNLSCPVYILKADGGTLPLAIAARYPLESIYSGPAASVLGALAAAGPGATAVMLDIGGTTTDLGLIIQGVPLMAEKGAQVNGYPLSVRSLAVSSLALGGDTAVAVEDGRVMLREKTGAALCLGGPELTVTDILVSLGLSEIGDIDTALAAVKRQEALHTLPPGRLAQGTLQIFLDAIARRLEEMYLRWEEEPAYRVWQLLQPRYARPRAIVCIGGPAQALGKLLAQEKGWDVLIPEHADVANAIGAALAKTTLRLDFYGDTQQRAYSTNVSGIGGRLPEQIRSLEQAKAYAHGLFQEAAQAWRLEEEKPEIIYAEGFNSIRGWDTVGKIFQIGLQTPPGLSGYLCGEAEADG